MRVFVGHGYRPHRALGALLVLIVVVAVTFLIPEARHAMRSVNPPGTVYSTSGRISTSVQGSRPKADIDTCDGGTVVCFNAVAFAVETVVPLVSMGQRTTWSPNGSPTGSVMLWWLNIATLLGWLLSSVFVLSFARIARNSP